MACLRLRKGISPEGETSRSVNLEMSKETEGKGESGGLLPIGRRAGCLNDKELAGWEFPSPSISFLDVAIEMNNENGYGWERDSPNNTAFGPYDMEHQKSQHIPRVSPIEHFQSASNSVPEMSSFILTV